MKKLDVIAYFGGVTKTAKALGISKSAVSLWGGRNPLRSRLSGPAPHQGEAEN
ncbi:Cro/CI family transcriptional regulator [Aeromonas veronii]|uniref:Cro/CI family transcriptional regulator n=1 Tax=Aeromonas veronii TaxID=654 RepID=UPI003DA37B66